MQEELRDAELKKAQLQESCSHKDANGSYSVSPIRNYPDRQIRLICLHCHKLFEPRHWEIGAPDPENPRGKPFLKNADSNYPVILAAVMQKQNV